MFQVFSLAFLKYLLWWPVATPLLLSSDAIAPMIIMQNMKFMDSFQSSPSKKILMLG